MRALWAKVICVGVLLVGTACAAEVFGEDTEPPLIEAGLATVDVTPPVPFRMSGYFSERLSTGIHDPLLAKAVVFRQGDCAAAMVFCDVVGISRKVSDGARKSAEEKTGIPAEHIVIVATHSHTGPLYFGALRKHFHDGAVARHGEDPLEKIDYESVLSEKLVEVIARASSSLTPVTLDAGVTPQEGLAFNRRFHLTDGSVRFNPGVRNPKIVREAGPIDPEVGILLVRDAVDQEPLASLTVFALHLDTTGGTLYSGDYPSYLAGALGAGLGERFVSLFGSGTCGDINHIDVRGGKRPSAKILGETIAATVRERLPSLDRVARPSLAVAGRVVDVPIQRYGAAEIAGAGLAMEKVASREVPFLDRVEAYKIMALQLRDPQTLPLEVQVFKLGEETAVVTLPGEVFVDLGLAIKRASPFATTIVIELANDAPGYLPTRKAFAEGSYETVNSRIQPGGGERVVEAALELLHELDGSQEVAWQLLPPTL